MKTTRFITLSVLPLIAALAGSVLRASEEKGNDKAKKASKVDPGPARTARPITAIRTIDLPAPQTEGGKPLMQALKARESSGSYGDRQLSRQTLSNLLWAAAGINHERPDKGAERTSSHPSYHNWGEIDVYVIMADGLYLYQAKGNKLHLLLTDDLRTLAGKQDFVKTAPVNLIYVTSYEPGTNEQNKYWYSALSVTLVAENVYLFCASEGLNTIVRAGIDRDALAKAMHLPEQDVIVFGQSVGYPK
jgi:nitroreductase